MDPPEHAKDLPLDLRELQLGREAGVFLFFLEMGDLEGGMAG